MEKSEELEHVKENVLSDLQELAEHMEEVSLSMQDLQNDEVNLKALELINASRTVVSWSFDIQNNIN